MCVFVLQGLNCSVVVQMVSNVKALHSETELLLAGKMCMVSLGVFCLSECVCVSKGVSECVL